MQIRAGRKPELEVISRGANCQLRRIADALERIAAAIEPNRKAWTTEKEDSANLHSMIYRLLTMLDEAESKRRR